MTAAADEDDHSDDRPAWPKRRRKRNRSDPPPEARPLPLDKLNLSSPLRSAGRLLLYLSATFALMPVQMLLSALSLPWRRDLPFFFHRLCRPIFGMRIAVRGTMADHAPTLFVANHGGYVDITILGSLIRGSFVAKREVASYPLFGFMAKLQRTVFVDRSRGKAAEQRDQLTDRLQAGENLILFPEGTSSDGNRVLPFKSALFAVGDAARAAGTRLRIQPVSIAYVRLDGLPMGRHLRPNYAWYGDMDMAPHIWNLLGIGRLTVIVTFHDPVAPEDFPSRKALARHCESAVAAGVAESLSGRPQRREAA